MKGRIIEIEILIHNVSNGLGPRRPNKEIYGPNFRNYLTNHVVR